MEHIGLIISKLSLKNFATFDDQTIQFSEGFNAIVGETGSGKSLILDAIQLILGQRADKKLIRKDCDYAIVESSFECSDGYIKSYFDKIGFPFDNDEILIKRILYKNGKTKSFLNHQNCSLQNLNSFSKRFVDLVGQFENQKLLSENYQLQLLDNYSLHETILEEYQKVFKQLETKMNALNEQQNISSERQQKKDYLEFQLNEFSKLNISIERELELLDKKRILQNLEENKAAIEEVNFIFEGSSDSVGLSSLLNKLEKLLSEKLVSQNDINLFMQAHESITELNYKINSSLDLDFDEEEFETVIDELDQYQKLKRKYGVDTEGLLEIQKNFQNELENIQNLNSNLDKLTKEINLLKNKASALASNLHESRVKNADKLSKHLTKEIQNLRMNGARIFIELTKTEQLYKNGFSQINFLAETNQGEGRYKIKDIASGGELSRILLALRTVLSSKDSISIFLFDEIDSGIGGETAVAVGRSLKSVSLNSQVVAITHLPQIANFADKLVLVSKTTKTTNDKSRTISFVKEVAGESLKKEVLSMTNLN